MRIIVVFQTLIPRNVADRANGRAAELASLFRDSIGHGTARPRHALTRKRRCTGDGSGLGRTVPLSASYRGAVQMVP
jgi:hypothetical protein